MPDEIQNLTRRLLHLHGIEPTSLPIPVTDIARHYARVEYLPVPFEFDGATWKTRGKSPHIVINSQRPGARNVFTLAHELGHIIIPWHVGIILDQEIGPVWPTHGSEYRILEAEANRFAAEILLPEPAVTEWLNREMQSNNLERIGDLIELLAHTAGVSLLSATLRVFPYLPPNFMYFVTNKGSEVLYKGKSKGTVITFVKKGVQELESMFEGVGSLQTKETTSLRYLYWDLRPKGDFIPPTDTDWRDVLEAIIAECFPLEQEAASWFYKSINSRIGVLFGTYVRHSAESFGDAYVHINQRLRTYDDLHWLVRHRRFEEFTKKKAADLYSRI